MARTPERKVISELALTPGMRLELRKANRERRVVELDGTRWIVIAAPISGSRDGVQARFVLEEAAE